MCVLNSYTAKLLCQREIMVSIFEPCPLKSSSVCLLCETHINSCWGVGVIDHYYLSLKCDCVHIYKLYVLLTFSYSSSAGLYLRSHSASGLSLKDPVTPYSTWIFLRVSEDGTSSTMPKQHSTTFINTLQAHNSQLDMTFKSILYCNS